MFLDNSRQHLTLLERCQCLPEPLQDGHLSKMDALVCPEGKKERKYNCHDANYKFNYMLASMSVIILEIAKQESYGQGT